MLRHSVPDAIETARRLVEPLGRRWSHVQAVAACAGQVAESTGLNTEALVAAAWLHDIGYAGELADTGFHPVDGARYLRRAGWNEQIVSLVAHHSCARFEASVRGLESALSEFARPAIDLEDALCFCDMTNGPSGEPVNATSRLDEIQARYGAGDAVYDFVEVARPEILAAVDRVSTRLAASQPM